MLALSKGIDSLNEGVGRLTGFLAIPLILIVCYEVVMRYLFNAPTSWAFELTTFFYGMHYMLGVAYTYAHDGHVAIDIFESRLPAKPRTLLRMVVNLVIFLPTTGLLGFYSIIYAGDSWENWERASTSWAPPLYPFKTIMAIGFVLLFLQGLSKLIRDFHQLRNND